LCSTRWNNKKINFTFNYFKYVLWNNQKNILYTKGASEFFLGCQEMAVRLMKRPFYFHVDRWKFLIFFLEMNFWYENVRWRVTMCRTRACPHDNIFLLFCGRLGRLVFKWSQCLRIGIICCVLFGLNYSRPQLDDTQTNEFLCGKKSETKAQRELI